MGCNSSTAQGTTSVDSLIQHPNPNGKKTVIIVGFSIAGYTAGEAIWDDVNLVFVDARDHFEYVPTVLKSAVDETWKDKITTTFADSVSGYKDKFRFVQGTIQNVNGDGKTIDVELAAGKRKVSLPYDVLIIATGFLYDAPIKQAGVITLADRKKSLDNFTAQVKAAKNIAVVGGGIVGVELVGEIAFHPQASEKKIHLIVSGDKLLKQVHTDAHGHADKFLKEKNVTIHYNTKYTDELKKKEGFDLVVQCTGQKYKADFLKKNFATSISKNGQVYVNDHF